MIFEIYLTLYHVFSSQASGITLVVVGYYGAKHGIGLTAKAIEARLGKPSLVRETSRFTVSEAFKHPIKVLYESFCFL